MSYIFYWPSTKKFEETLILLKWVKKNCPSYITKTNDYFEDYFYYSFHFGNEQDYVLTLLRWS